MAQLVTCSLHRPSVFSQLYIYSVGLGLPAEISIICVGSHPTKRVLQSLSARMNVLNNLRTAERIFMKPDTELSYEKLLSISILVKTGQTRLTLYTDIHKHFCTHRDSAKSPPTPPPRNEVLTAFSRH